MYVVKRLFDGAYLRTSDGEHTWKLTEAKYFASREEADVAASSQRGTHFAQRVS